MTGAGASPGMHLVGFDATAKLTDAMAAGKIDGLVVQNPFRMGEVGVQMVLDKLAGRPIDRRVDTGATMVTRENMSQPDITALLSPNLAKYLDQ